jgi:uncharacterized membrane-anchored protein
MLGLVLAVQLRLNRYVPIVYWLTAVVLSVAGTLYTDILTDSLDVPLALSTTVFAVLLAIVFGTWYVRERTLSIHSIVTTPRELFYWLAVLVTFALGTAVGDWTIVLTGWGPGTSVLLPAGLIVAIVVGWRFGANTVLSFWLAYILTRPLGANLGDWFASPSAQHGLGLGYGITSVIFLATILAAVVYLTLSRADVIEQSDDNSSAVAARPVRERIMLGYYAVVAGMAGALMIWAAGQPHAAPANASDEEGASTSTSVALAPGQATAKFPPAEVSAPSPRTRWPKCKPMIRQARRVESRISKPYGMTTNPPCNQWTRPPGLSSTVRLTTSSRHCGPASPIRRLNRSR